MVLKNFINPKGHQNRIVGSKLMAILLKGWILPIGTICTIWWSCIGKSLHLQPAQQACFQDNREQKVKITKW